MTKTTAEVLISALQDPIESGVYVINDDALVSCARQNEKRPAYVQFACPDEFVKNITGGELRTDYYFFIRLPASYVDKVVGKLDNSSVVKNEPEAVIEENASTEQED